ncbi:hypothetical protein P1J78_04120 [Psychromarinibacter sp. C21-152]|uniref:Uncharacterized protein n=1 Tax=Psychromarinibacter sediminicola TaxID=3033385 RepID=A0AAE3NQ17_9RHOB|nr:hypothetical protein [Psychromarinibacter sediminicola]MDF0599911.1 hypothetical protein [Psychromarinibacter sediminicola]
MTKDPVCGNGPAMSSLKERLNRAQNTSMKLFGIMEAIDFLDNESACAGGKTVLIGVATEMAHSLNIELDSVNFPEVVE